MIPSQQARAHASQSQAQTSQQTSQRASHTEAESRPRNGQAADRFEVTQKTMGPDTPRPKSGTRFVVTMLTTLQGVHASPADMCERIIASYGGDAARAAREVDLVVGVNRLLSIAQSTEQNLAPLQKVFEQPLPLRSEILIFGWEYHWRDRDGTLVTRKTVQADLLARPHHRHRMLNEEAQIAPPMGLLRERVARYAQPMQQRVGEERVWSIVTDADAMFPIGYFDALKNVPQDKRVLSGGFRFEPSEAGFAHVQNTLDMHIRRSVDPAVPYYPEPNLAIDTSALSAPLQFGSAKLESRRLLDWLGNAPHAGNEAYLKPSQLTFSADPRLCVQTDGKRFSQRATYPTTFADAMRQIAQQPQSHARTFAWAHQLMAATGISSHKLAPLASLYAVPALMGRGILAPQAVRSHLDALDVWFQNRCAGHNSPASVFDRFIDVAGLHGSSALIWHTGKQMRLWADATLETIEEHLLNDASPQTRALRDDYQHRLATQAPAGACDDALVINLLDDAKKQALSVDMGSATRAPSMIARVPLLALDLARLEVPQAVVEPVAPALPQALSKLFVPAAEAPSEAKPAKREALIDQGVSEAEINDLLTQDHASMHWEVRLSQSLKRARDDAMQQLRDARQRRAPSLPQLSRDRGY